MNRWEKHLLGKEERELLSRVPWREDRASPREELNLRIGIARAWLRESCASEPYLLGRWYLLADGRTCENAAEPALCPSTHAVRAAYLWLGYGKGCPPTVPFFLELTGHFPPMSDWVQYFIGKEKPSSVVNALYLNIDGDNEDCMRCGDITSPYSNYCENCDEALSGEDREEEDWEWEEP